MPLFGLNTNDIFVKNLRLSADGTEIDDAVISASVYDKTQIDPLKNRATAAPITGAANISLNYQPVTSTQSTKGHYRGSIASTVGLTVGQRVAVHYTDNGTYGVDVLIETTVERRSS